MKNFTPEMIEKARAIGSVRELLTLAKENNIEMTEEEANAYYLQLNRTMRELSDDELNDVSGGGCYGSGGRLIVTILHSCDDWTCARCGREFTKVKVRDWQYPADHPNAYTWGLAHPRMNHCDFVMDEDAWVCKNCKHMSYESGIWYCNHPNHRK
ncbi:MAG: hypothetical protein IJ489_06510 [Clostridia bacterium]|nr:hypothetical protein [Clostridia bacterium]